MTHLIIRDRPCHVAAPAGHLAAASSGTGAAPSAASPEPGQSGREPAARAEQSGRPSEAQGAAVAGLLGRRAYRPAAGKALPAPRRGGSPAASPGPRLPVALQREICEHRFSRTAVTRVLGAKLGAVAATDPGAAAAARSLLTRLRRLIDAVFPQHAPWEQLLAVLEPDGVTPRRSRVGDIAAADVAAACEGEDVRVLINMARNVECLAASALFAVAAQAHRDAAAAADLAERAGINLALASERYAQLPAARRSQPDAFLEALPHEPTAALSAMRRRMPWRGAAGHEANRWSDAPQLPRLSAAELRVQGVPPGARRRLPVGGGVQLFAPVADHPWHCRAHAAGMHTAVSISGTTDRLLWLDSMLGSNRSAAAELTVAIVGHLVPDHHSYHEVMAAAAAHAVPYEATPAAMRAACRVALARPVGTHPDAREARRQLTAALADTFMVDPFDLMALPAEAIARVVAAVAPADVPSLLLVSPALGALAALPSPGTVRQLEAALGRCADPAAVRRLLAQPASQPLLAQITRLSLPGRGLGAAEVDAIVARCPRLVAVDLHDSPLGALPASLRAHPRLEQLRLARTGLTSLPSLDLPALVSLDLSGNDIEALPPSLARSRGLMTLLVRHTRVVVLPGALAEGQGLRVLGLPSPQP